MPRTYLGRGGPLGVAAPPLDRWWTTPGGQAGSMTPVLNALYLWPLLEPAVQVQQVAVDVATAVAGATVRGGFYPDAAGAGPDWASLITDLGSVDASTQNLKTWTPGSPFALPGGVVWAALVLQGATGVVLRSGIAGATAPILPYPPGVTPGTGNNVAQMWAVTGQSGALPTSQPSPLSVVQINVPKIFLRRSAS